MGNEALRVDVVSCEEQLELGYPTQQPIAMCDYSV